MMDCGVEGRPTELDAPPETPARPAVFRVLGPLTLASGDESLVLPPSKVTSLLAALLLHPDEVVSASTLQQAVWGDEQPASARAALQTCTLRLRQMFARHGITGNVIRTVPGGYRITASTETVDLLRFRDLIRRTRDEPDPEAELAMLEQALALWSDPMLANVPSESLHRDLVPRISEERVRAIERVCDLKIGLGRDRSVLVDLWTATRAYLANERFSEQLVEVLYRTGRQADALAELRRIRARLGTELGVDPGPGLRGLELAILRGEPPTQPTTATGETLRVAPRPTHHSTFTPGFVGRVALGRTIADRIRSGCPIVVLSGPPGVGKTALARHVAASVADDFPGGLLPVEAGLASAAVTVGGAERHPPARPGLGVGPLDLGPGPGAGAPGGRRLLLVDDVADTRQALELPALLAPGDVMLLTSRQSLSGLVARLGGWLHRVEPLDAADSLEVLGAVLGAERVHAEPQAATDLAALCEHFPLALRIAATRILLRPRLTLAEAVAWLRADPLGRLSLTGDPDMSLAFRFDDALARAGAALTGAFVRLCTAAGPAGPTTAAGPGPTAAAADPDLLTAAGPGPTATGPELITVERAAELLDVVPATARDLLDELVDHSLVEEAAEHYWIRDLLRLHARAVADRYAHPHGSPPSPDHAKGPLR